MPDDRKALPANGREDQWGCCVARLRGKNGHVATSGIVRLVLLGVPVAFGVLLLAVLARNAVFLILLLAGGFGLIFWRSKVRASAGGG